MQNSWTLVYLRQRGEKPYLLAGVGSEGKHVKCWWTLDFNNRFQLGYDSSNPDQELAAILQGIRQHLIDTGRFTKDQLDILYG